MTHHSESQAKGTNGLICNKTYCPAKQDHTVHSDSISFQAREKRQDDLQDDLYLHIASLKCITNKMPSTDCRIPSFRYLISMSIMSRKLRMAVTVHPMQPEA